MVRGGVRRCRCVCGRGEVGCCCIAMGKRAPSVNLPCKANGQRPRRKDNSPSRDSQATRIGSYAVADVVDVSLSCHEYMLSRISGVVLAVRGSTRIAARVCPRLLGTNPRASVSLAAQADIYAMSL